MLRRAWPVCQRGVHLGFVGREGVKHLGAATWVSVANLEAVYLLCGSARSRSCDCSVQDSLAPQDFGRGGQTSPRWGLFA